MQMVTSKPESVVMIEPEKFRFSNVRNAYVCMKV